VRRVLFDENLPKLLRRELPGFEVVTIDEAGWKGIKNGELLRRAQQAFDCFLTADRNLPHQQTLAALQLGVVVLQVGSTKLRDLAAYAPEIQTALAAWSTDSCSWCCGADRCCTGPGPAHELGCARFSGRGDGLRARPT
jgi:hypothetical protein